MQIEDVPFENPEKAFSGFLSLPVFGEVEEGVVWGEELDCAQLTFALIAHTLRLPGSGARPRTFQKGFEK